MGLLKGKLRQLRALAHKRRVEEELDEELAIHVEMETEKNIREGMSPAKARRAALLAFGGVERTKERVRDARWTRWVEDLIADLRLAVRTFAKSPGFATGVVLTMALGIGANTAAFTELYHLLLRPLDFKQPERIVAVEERRPNGYWMSVSSANYLDWVERNRVFDLMAASSSGGVVLTSGDEPARLHGVRVSRDYFKVLGVQPLIGRTFTADEDREGGPDVVVLSHALWSSRFGADTTLIGSTVTLDGRPTTVIGVMPPHFEAYSRGRATPQIWRPYAFASDYPVGDRDAHYLRVIARLAPDMDVERAREDMEAIAGSLAEEYPGTNKGWGVTVTPFLKELTSDARAPVLLVVGAMALVLLIGCVNVANLMLARATSRSAELAMRKALGASRSRLGRQLLTEAMLLSLLGGVLGLLVAFALVPVMAAAVPEGMPRLDQVHVDQVALAFTLVASVITAVLFGTIPAMRGAGVDLLAVLKEGGDCKGMRARPARGTLVAVELAFAFLLLTGAMLMLNSFARLTRVPRNYDPESIFAVNVILPRARYAIEAVQAAGERQEAIWAPRETERTFVREVLERLSRLPGVEAAVVANRPPGTSLFGPIAAVRREDEPPPGRGDVPRWVLFRAASPGYFETLRVPLRSGRTFTRTDDRADVAVISEALAQELWPGRDPVGKRLVTRGLSEPPERTLEVVGVVADVLEAGYGRIDWLSLPQQAIYIPYERQGASYRGMMIGWRMPKWFLVRSAASPEVVAPALRRAIWDVDPALPIDYAGSLEGMVQDGIQPRRAVTTMLLAFGLLGVLLAATGVYGLTAYSMASRTREIGIRMALGAVPRRVVGMFLQRSAVLGLAGIGVGAAGAWALARFLRGMLYGVHPHDPLTLGLVAALLLGVSLLATLVPARRAARVDPVRAIRYE